jgi:hypothetical protein
MSYSLEINAGLFFRKQIRNFLKKCKWESADIDYFELKYIFDSDFTVKGSYCDLMQIKNAIFHDNSLQEEKNLKNRPMPLPKLTPGMKPVLCYTYDGELYGTCGCVYATQIELSRQLEYKPAC